MLKCPWKAGQTPLYNLDRKCVYIHNFGHKDIWGILFKSTVDHSLLYFWTGITSGTLDIAKLSCKSQDFKLYYCELILGIYFFIFGLLRGFQCLLLGCWYCSHLWSSACRLRETLKQMCVRIYEFFLIICNYMFDNGKWACCTSVRVGVLYCWCCMGMFKTKHQQHMSGRGDHRGLEVFDCCINVVRKWHKLIFSNNNFG